MLDQAKVQAAVAEGVQAMRAHITQTRDRPTIEKLDYYAKLAAGIAINAFVEGDKPAEVVELPAAEPDPVAGELAEDPAADPS